MSTAFVIDAEPRDQLGRGPSKRLRSVQNQVPAILYGGREPGLSLKLQHNQLFNALQTEAFYSHILTINVAGQKPIKAVLKDVQRHPYKPRITHVDFLRINESEKLHMRVPLHFKGEQDAPGIKSQGGIATHHMSDIEVVCLPADLPEFIEIDISSLELGQSVHLASLTPPAGVAFTAATAGHNPVVVSIRLPQVEKEPVAAAEGTETPAEGAEEAGEEEDSDD